MLILIEHGSTFLLPLFMNSILICVYSNLLLYPCYRPHTHTHGNNNCLHLRGGDLGDLNIGQKIGIIYCPLIARKTHIGQPLMLTLKSIGLPLFNLLLMYFECKGHFI